MKRKTSRKTLLLQEDLYYIVFETHKFLEQFIFIIIFLHTKQQHHYNNPELQVITHQSQDRK